MSMTVVHSPIVSTTDRQPKIAILLATFQGQHHLSAQFDSFAKQTHQNWVVWVSDDGSSDDTCSILECYKEHWPVGRLFSCKGPANGYAANFLSLVCTTAISADYYAYADQDDIWEADKLARAVAWIQSVPSDIPTLYCSCTYLVDEYNRTIGLSTEFTKPPSFANALVQNIAGGNTMVFNNAARELLREAGQYIPVIAHDWWTYMLVSGCGGQIFYDSTPTLRYRQHENNTLGTNLLWPGRLGRIRMLFQGRFKQWNDTNIAAIKSMQHKLTPDNLRRLEQFSAAREMRLPARLFYLMQSGIYRQTMLGNLGLITAAILRKL